MVFSVSLLVLSGCGGSNSNPAPVAPVTPGSCQAGYVYSSQYGCMNQAGCQAGTARDPQGNCVTVVSVPQSCQQNGQGPVVYAGPQYGCLPTLGCPAGQGAYVDVNGRTSCIPAQTSGTGSSGCPVGQIMTSKGCLPEGIYPCSPGFGFLENRCYAGNRNYGNGNGNGNGNMGNSGNGKSGKGPNSGNTGNSDDEIDTDESDDSEDDDYIYSSRPCRPECAPRVKVKRGGRVVKYKYPKHCR